MHSANTALPASTLRILSRIPNKTSFTTPGALFRPWPSHGSSPAAAFFVLTPEAARAWVTHRSSMRIKSRVKVRVHNNAQCALENAAWSSQPAWAQHHLSTSFKDDGLSAKGRHQHETSTQYFECSIRGAESQ